MNASAGTESQAAGTPETRRKAGKRVGPAVFVTVSYTHLTLPTNREV